MGSGRLGEILVAEGLSPADLARGLAVARAEKTRLGSALVLLGLRTSDEVATALSRQKGVPAARDKHLAAIAPGTRALLSAATARRLCAVPVGVLRGEPPGLVVAMRDPEDAAAIALLAQETGYEIRPAVACEARLREAIDGMGEDPPRFELAAPTIDELTPPPRGLPPPPLELPEPDALTPPPGPLLAPETIDLTPTTLDLPAPPLDRPSPIAQVPPAAKPIKVTDDLELDGPPRAPVPRSAPMARLPLLAAPPIGGAVLDEPPSRSGPSLLAILGLIVLIGGGGLLAWDYFHDDSPAPGTPLSGEFHAKRLDATLTLPGTDWIEGREPLSGLPKMPNGGELRADYFTRGDLKGPKNVLVIARLTMDGQFANLPPDQFQELVAALESSGGTFGNGLFSMNSMSCTQDTMNGKPRAVCRGAAERTGTPYTLVFLFWIASNDDALVLFYLDPTDAGAAMDLAQSIRLD